MQVVELSAEARQMQPPQPFAAIYGPSTEADTPGPTPRCRIERGRTYCLICIQMLINLYHQTAFVTWISQCPFYVKCPSILCRDEPQLANADLAIPDTEARCRCLHAGQ
jgi:hypothetical protein